MSHAWPVGRRQVGAAYGVDANVNQEILQAKYFGAAFQYNHACIQMKNLPFRLSY